VEWILHCGFTTGTADDDGRFEGAGLDVIAAQPIPKTKDQDLTRWAVAGYSRDKVSDESTAVVLIHHHWHKQARTDRAPGSS
jgi:hypothetical protein